MLYIQIDAPSLRMSTGAPSLAITICEPSVMFSTNDRYFFMPTPIFNAMEAKQMNTAYQRTQDFKE